MHNLTLKAKSRQISIGFFLLISLFLAFLAGIGLSLVLPSVTVFLLTSLLLLGLGIAYPQTALAIQFVGISLYVVVFDRLGISPTRETSALFFSILVIGYLTGGLRTNTTKIKEILFSTPSILFLSFIGWMVAVWLFSGDRVFATVRLQEAMYIPLLMLGPFYGIQMLKKEKFFSFLKIVVGLTVVLIIIGLLQGTTQENLRWTISKSVNPLGFAYSVAIGALIAVGVWLLRGRKARIFSVLVMIGALYLIISSGSRGPLLSLFFGLTIWLFFSIQNTKRSISWFLLLIGVSLFSLVLLDQFIPDYSLERISSLFRIVEDPESGVLYSESRLLIWNRSLILWKHFFLTGNGIGAYALIDPRYRTSHNIILEILVETGLIGLFIFLIYTVMVIKEMITVFQNSSDKKVGAVLFGLLALVFVSVLFSFQVQSAYQFWMTNGMALLWVSLNKQK